MRNWLNKYFDFTKSEFNGLLVLVFLIMAVTAAPYAYAQFVKEEYRPEDYLMVKRLILKDEQAEANGKSQTKARREALANIDDKAGRGSYTSPPGTSAATHQTKLFQFDPNVTSQEGWVKLGLSERQAGAILKYIAKGGQFRQATDLKKMYTISPEKYAQLYPYVNIPQASIAGRSSLAETHSSFVETPSSSVNRQSPLVDAHSSIGNGQSASASTGSSLNYNAASKANSGAAKNRYGYDEKTVANPTKKPFLLIEINAADSAALDDIRGIGPTFASRILKYRSRLGGFVQKAQLMEVFGLDSLKYLEIRDQISVDLSGVKMININTVTADHLRNHPYLRYKQVNALIQYRKQHGNYSNIADLAKVVLIPAETIAQLAPYLTF